MLALQAAKLRFRLTRLGIPYFLFVAALLVISMIQRLNLMTLFFSVTLTPAFVAFWQGRRNLTGLTLERNSPAEIHADSPFDVEITISNTRRWTSALGLEMSLEHSPDSTQGPTLLPAVPAKGSVRHWLRIPGLPRGRHALKGVTLRSRFPMGIFAFSRRYSGDESIVVFPRLGRIHRASPVHPLPGQDIATIRGKTLASTSDQYHHLREYRIGDNPRHIHWPSTARRGQFMVKQFEPEGARPTLLIIDPSLPRSPTAEQSQQFETLLSYAATMAAEWTKRADSRLTLAILGNPNIVLEGYASPRWLKAVFFALSDVVGISDIDVHARIQEIVKVRGEGHLLCLASLMLDATTATQLAAELGRGQEKPWHFLGPTDLGNLFSVAGNSD